MAKTRGEETTYHDHHNFHHIWKRKYNGMKERVEGRSTNKHGAKGKELLTWQEFLDWCLLPDNLSSFIEMFLAWREADYVYGLNPSIDRIDSDRGYALDNIQWMVFVENIAKGGGHQGE